MSVIYYTKKGKIETDCWDDLLRPQLHRENGPALIDDEGTKFWYIKGKTHRKDGPAVVFTDGNEHWYYNGKVHRSDGPAVTDLKGNEHWYIHNSHKTNEIKEWIKENNLPNWKDWDTKTKLLFKLTWC